MVFYYFVLACQKAMPTASRSGGTGTSFKIGIHTLLYKLIHIHIPILIYRLEMLQSLPIPGIEWQ